MKATILSIGDELLIGQTLNTNAHWMSQQLTAIGVDVLRHVSVSDKRAEIVGALDTAMADTQVILITGGLGPTSDDITKDVLCEYFGGSLVFNEAAYENIRQIFNRRNREISEATRQVAFLPDNCLPIQNAFGTAAGMLFRRDDRVVVSMPGVPYEMKAMVENGVIPYLQSEFTLPLILHHHFYTAGVGETQLAELLTDFEKNKPADMGLAYLPSVGKVRLRLTLKGQDKADLQSRMQAARETVYAAVKAHVYAEEDIPLEQVVGRLLAERGKTLGTAESCTGGYIAHLITSVAGSSDYFKGSVIAYSNEIKQQVLGVQAATLEAHGAVSEQTVREMLSGALKVLDTDVAIAVSGVAGPGGGSEEKPVGTVYIGVADAETSVVLRHGFTNNRERNIQLSGVLALVMLKNFLQDR